MNASIAQVPPKRPKPLFFAPPNGTLGLFSTVPLGISVSKDA
jgi:hypothetical protein